MHNVWNIGKVLGFYWYIINIDEYFDKNIYQIEMVQNLCKCLNFFQKIIK